MHTKEPGVYGEQGGGRRDSGKEEFTALQYGYLFESVWGKKNVFPFKYSQDVPTF